MISGAKVSSTCNLCGFVAEGRNQTQLILTMRKHQKTHEKIVVNKNIIINSQTSETIGL